MIRGEVLDPLPATAAEVMEATGLSHEEAYESLVGLESRGIVRIECVRATGERVWHRAPGT